ncbi:hypothetical protein GCM10010277_83180 [Streptomyces longisporoflavus]|nr:hypothetical protein GCM10010277_83180 [Streptomyces longisporoflavus]
MPDCSHGVNDSSPQLFDRSANRYPAPFAARASATIRRTGGTFARARPIRFSAATCVPGRAAVPSFHSARPICPISRAVYDQTEQLQRLAADVIPHPPCATDSAEDRAKAAAR